MRCKLEAVGIQCHADAMTATTGAGCLNSARDEFRVSWLGVLFLRRSSPMLAERTLRWGGRRRRREVVAILAPLSGLCAYLPSSSASSTHVRQHTTKPETQKVQHHNRPKLLPLRRISHSGLSPVPEHALKLRLEMQAPTPPPAP